MAAMAFHGIAIVSGCGMLDRGVRVRDAGCGIEVSGVGVVLAILFSNNLWVNEDRDKGK